MSGGNVFQIDITCKSDQSLRVLLQDVRREGGDFPLLCLWQQHAHSEDKDQQPQCQVWQDKIIKIKMIKINEEWKNMTVI